MAEDEKLFYTIGEVAQIVNVKPYVLRYWETEFRKLNPQKSQTGQRTYRLRDLRVASTIKRLLYDEQYTIAGAIKKLEELDGKDGLDPLDSLKFKSEIQPVQPNDSFEALPEEKPLMNPTTPVLEREVTDSKPSRPPEKISELKKLIDATKAIFKKYNLS